MCTQPGFPEPLLFLFASELVPHPTSPQPNPFISVGMFWKIVTLARHKFRLWLSHKLSVQRQAVTPSSGFCLHDPSKRDGEPCPKARRKTRVPMPLGHLHLSCTPTAWSSPCELDKPCHSKASGSTNQRGTGQTWASTGDICLDTVAQRHSGTA